MFIERALEAAKADPQPPPPERTLVLLDRRALHRECLTHALTAADPSFSVLSFASAAEWLEPKQAAATPCLVILHIDPSSPHGQDVGHDLPLIQQAAPAVPVVLLSDEENPKDIIGLLNSGVQGYVPTSLPLSVAVEAMHVVAAGGSYVPASSLLTCCPTMEPSDQTVTGSVDRGFTNRQTAVLKALREGKPNKVIARELGMAESTVKIHVRNIMKKLKARNRTEVAFKAAALFASESRHPPVLESHGSEFPAQGEAKTAFPKAA